MQEKYFLTSVSVHLRNVFFMTIIASLSFVAACNDQADSAPTSDQQLTIPVVVKDTPEIKKLPPKPEIHYQLVSSKEWLKDNKKDTAMMNIVTALNRTDNSHLRRIDSIVVPDSFAFSLPQYLPFPLELEVLAPVNKIVLFSYPTQVFAAYKNGVLEKTGPVNMGRKGRLTPTGLFFTNWKAEHTISTVNDEWDLYWNFNIANRQGVGWHQYALPGYPASHSCLRLQDADARYLYSWADQWKLSDPQTVAVKGTPVIVFGAYDFDGKKPWLQLMANPHALDIETTELEKIIQPYLQEILQVQAKRDSLNQAKVAAQNLP